MQPTSCATRGLFQCFEGISLVGFTLPTGRHTAVSRVCSRCTSKSWPCWGHPMRNSTKSMVQAANVRNGGEPGAVGRQVKQHQSARRATHRRLGLVALVGISVVPGDRAHAGRVPVGQGRSSSAVSRRRMCRRHYPSVWSAEQGSGSSPDAPSDSISPAMWGTGLG